ncbi:zinc metalloprotease [Geoglobus ahangari]|nr:hypothetical protein [Geoglobus ahangari]
MVSMKPASIASAVLSAVLIGIIAVSALNIGEELKPPEKLTKEELTMLYDKYNVTENDIKFAKGELPHYLAGTALDGKVITMGKVKVENGRTAVEDWVDPELYKWALKNGYRIINATKWFEIEEKAREEYMRKYGVDPQNPKVEIVDGVPLPVEYVRKLVERGILKPSDGGAMATSVATGPWAKNDVLYLWIFEAIDQKHKPIEAYLQDTVNAYSRFYQFNPGTLYYYHITDYWDASDVSSDISEDLLDDLAQDTDWWRGEYNDRDPVNDIVIGWVKYADRNGMAKTNGFFSIGATQAAGVDWQHDSIAQHEISHNFNANDAGMWPWEHPECIMNYYYAGGRNRCVVQ